MRLIAACLLCVGAAFAEPMVVATKLDPGYVLPTATMPESLWTNSVLWLTAESPVLNEGTTSAEWICYAKTCSGNAVQATLDRQPARVFTNGAWALSFDGSTDVLESGYTGYSSNFTIAVRMRPFAIPASAAGAIISQYNTSGNKRSWALAQRTATDAGVLRLQISATGSTLITSASIPQSAILEDVATYVFRMSGTTVHAWVNGSSVGVTSNIVAAPFNSGEPIRIGNDAGVFWWKGDIEWVAYFPVALSDEDIQELSR